MRSDSSVTITRGSRNSFHDHMNSSTTRVSTAGFPVGSATRTRVWNDDAPSTSAASSIGLGTERKNARIQNVPKQTLSAICGRIIDA